MPLTLRLACFLLGETPPDASMPSAFSPPTAVILAAGLGARLRPVQADKPKGFVIVGGNAIIARTLALLGAAGVRDIVLVAGWREEIYRDFLASHHPAVRLVTNRDYATTGSLASLVIGVQDLPGDVLVIESDLLYEARALTALLAARGRNTLLASGPTGSGDEVWVHGRHGRLAHLGKEAWSGAPRVGELVGLTRMSGELVQALVAAAPGLPASAHYEDGLNVVCPRQSVDILRLDDLAWCEIDDAKHLARARESIWPRICAADHAPAGAGK
jgi:2-aminoethylphosphonate-pyruvate transaminase